MANHILSNPFEKWWRPVAGPRIGRAAQSTLATTDAASLVTDSPVVDHSKGLCDAVAAVLDARLTAHASLGIDLHAGLADDPRAICCERKSHTVPATGPASRLGCLLPERDTGAPDVGAVSLGTGTWRVGAAGRITLVP